MNVTRWMALSMALSAALAVAPRSDAAVRPLPFSYSYDTPDEGEKSIGLYTDATTAGAIANQLALEVGITDHFTLTGYATFKQLDSFDAMKLEGRYRFAEKGAWPVDTGLFLDYDQPIDQSVVPALTAKLILERSFGAFTLTSNLIASEDFSWGLPGLGATLGADYAITDGFRPGVEGVLESGKAFAGPTTAAMVGPMQLSAGVLFGTQKAVLGRLILTQTF